MPTRKRRTKQRSSVHMDDITELKKEKDKQLFLKDFDTQVQKQLADMYKTLQEVPRQMALVLQHLLQELPEEVRHMSWDKFVECGGTIDAALSAIEYDDRVKKSISGNADLVKSAKKKKTKIARRPPLGSLTESGSEGDDSLAGATIARPTRQKKAASKRTLQMPASSTRSSRYRTPAHLHHPLPFPNDTPMATPAFNPLLPRTPGVRLLSLTGEPVNQSGFTVLPFTDKKNKKPLPVHFTMIDFSVDDVTLPEVDSTTTDQMRKMIDILNAMVGKSAAATTRRAAKK